MPSIRLNTTIRDQMYRKARDAYDKATPEPEMPVSLTEKIREALVNDPLLVKLGEFHAANAELLNEEKRSDLPRRIRQMLSPTEITACDVYCLAEDNAGYSRHRSIRVQLPAPLKISMSCSYAPDIYIDELEPKLRSQLQDEFLAFQAVTTSYNDLRNVYRKKVRDLITNVNTTGQFLEAWPAGIDLIPDEIVTKMHTKISRKQVVKNVKEKVEFDDSAASAVLMTAKLLG